ncbi:BMP family ABC transporter substrate-binding protein [Spirulina major CS-329]|uniref:BMP family ABC transporter substrate-binding protein n=1 Tax=Spirulina TaxID=1154 RepID=UPI00232E06EA|nr:MULTISPECIES: BMP family ABC transporter substrate-binding protein [Spirulina]MDB9496129.1 BMP family ABC transporter substrate-binding protein [Spirulina subsalsa CS-330]MDB9504921.1 BMP family ABC transporter substrate-binding protein [Spirulina major CS-329]
MQPPKQFPFSRRQVLRGLLATTAFGLTAKFGTGCTPAQEGGDEGDEAASGGGSEELVIGFLYVGPKDDFGYNQAHAEGAAAIAELPGVKIVEQASVPETSEVEEAMRSMIEIDGATVLFPTSFGYFDPHILKLAEEFPDVQFFHAGGLYTDDMPDNIGSYFGYIDEAQYVAGIVAGLTTESNKLGFVAAKPIPQVLRNINGFTLGAKSVNPDVTTQVIFTGDWAEPVKEAEAVNSMADQGIDVVTCHVDSPKVVIETAERRGMYSSGYHADQSALAPEGYLTGAEWDWTSIYTQYVEWLQAGKTLMNGDIPHIVRGGLESGFWKLSDFGPAVSDEAKAQAEEVKAMFADSSMVIYTGEIQDNTGEVKIPAGEELEQTAVELETMDWLVEGVDGSVEG